MSVSAMMFKTSFLVLLACCSMSICPLTDAFLMKATRHPGRSSIAHSRTSSSVHMSTASEEAGERRKDMVWDRRGALASAAGLWSVAALALAGPRGFRIEKAQAAVGEGGLPEVAESFNRILRTQRDFGKVSKTIADREGKIEDQEWVNTQIFLRNSYLVGNDMRRLVRDAEEKRGPGNSIASEFETINKEMDRLCKSKDWEAFLRNNDKVQALFRSFTDLLSDVPDEL